ncbi:MAG: lactonase family protein [Blastocatellia bacterium]
MQFQLFRSVNSAICVSLLFISLTLPAKAANRTIEHQGVRNDGFEAGGAVYVLTNQADSNTVIVFDRSPEGKLTRTQEVSTGGQGTGSGLGSQGALTASADGHLLFAVNAGSNSISVLGVTEDGLRLLSKVDSGGAVPISVTVHGDLVYVLNSGGSSPNITGFFLTPFGRLFPLSNSTRTLAGGANASPAEVSFTPDGELLVVTEKGTSLIDVFTIGFDGRPVKQTAQKSNNTEPFGFNFQGFRVLVVSEAATGAAGATTVSTYRMDDDNSTPLTTISASVPDTQTAACWIVVTRDRQFAFATNTGSGTISSYNLSPAGELTLRQAVAGDLGANSGPIDMALSRHGDTLLVLSPGSAAVTSFQIRSGNLSRSDSESIPASSSGIAAH